MARSRRGKLCPGSRRVSRLTGASVEARHGLWGAVSDAMSRQDPTIGAAYATNDQDHHILVAAGYGGASGRSDQAAGTIQERIPPAGDTPLH